MKKSLLALSAAMLVVSPAAAQDTAPALAPISEQSTANAVLRAGTPISLQMMEEITTKKKAAKVGQRFMLEVTAPIEVNGVTVIPAGTPAWGEIVNVRNKGMWGKSGKLDAKLLFARVNGRQIRLTGSFDDKGVTGTAGVVGAVALLPIAGFFMTGTSAVLPKAMPVGGFIDEDVPLAMAAAAPAPMQVSVPAAPVPVPAATSATMAVATPSTPQ